MKVKEIEKGKVLYDANEEFLGIVGIDNLDEYLERECYGDRTSTSYALKYIKKDGIRWFSNKHNANWYEEKRPCGRMIMITYRGDAKGGLFINIDKDPRSKNFIQVMDENDFDAHCFSLEFFKDLFTILERWYLKR